MKLSSIILLKALSDRNSDTVYSSRTYALEFSDSIESSSFNSSLEKKRWARYAEADTIDGLNSASSITSIVKALAAGYRNHTVAPESLDSVSEPALIRKLRAAYYSEYLIPTEGIESGSVISGITKKLVSYYIDRDLTPEGMDSDIAAALVNKRRIVQVEAFNDGINSIGAASGVTKSRKYFDHELLEGIDSTLGVVSITKRTSVMAPPETAAILHFNAEGAVVVEALLPFEDGSPEGTTDALAKYGDGKLKFTNAAPQVGSITLRFEK